jgi:hypothetical protein
MANRDLYLFLYHAGVVRDRDNQPFRMRDLEAAMMLVRALERKYGLKLRQAIYNYPKRGPGPYPFDLRRFRKGDLIVVPTRPPMDDEIVQNKRVIDRSYTELEYAIFAALRPTFRKCSRPEILLDDTVAAISSKIADRQSLLFHQNGGSMLDAYGKPDTCDYTDVADGERITTAFLVYVEEAWPDGPGLLVAFGLAGTETLVWAHHLAGELRGLLCTTTFALAEMPAAEPSFCTEDSDFAAKWPVKVVGRAPRLPVPPTLRRAARLSHLRPAGGAVTPQRRKGRDPVSGGRLAR